MLKSVLIEILGGYNTHQVEYIHTYYQNLLRDKDKELEELKSQKRVFEMCPNVRGLRYDRIVLPESKQEFLEYIHHDLIPTLREPGILQNKNFLKEIE